MNKYFLMLMTLFFTLPSLAEDETTGLLATNSIEVGIELKNREIMSNYKTYFQASRQQMQKKQSQVQLQYTEFLKSKAAS
jgi:hypothetical protein